MQVGPLKAHSLADRFSRLNRLLPDWILLTAAVVIGLGLLVSRYRPATPPSPGMELDQAQVAALEGAWGIRVTNVGLVGNGGLIDMRFQVIDPDKALGILDDDSYPVLIDEASGTALVRPTNHGGHTGTFSAGRTYYFIYQNVNGLVKAGSRLTLRIGEVALDHVLVR